MYQVTVDYAKTNLEELCDRAAQEPEGVAIVRDNRSYVLVTQEEWDARMQGVPNLLDSPANAARLLESLERARSGANVPQSVQSLREEMGLVSG